VQSQRDLRGRLSATEVPEHLTLAWRQKMPLAHMAGLNSLPIRCEEHRTSAAGEVERVDYVEDRRIERYAGNTHGEKQRAGKP